MTPIMELCEYVKATGTADQTQLENKLKELFNIHIVSGVIKIANKRYDFPCNVNKLLTQTSIVTCETQHMPDADFHEYFTTLRVLIYSLGYRESTRRTLMSKLNQFWLKPGPFGINDPLKYEICVSILKLDETETKTVIERDRQKVIDIHNNVLVFKPDFIEEYVRRYKSLTPDPETTTNTHIGRLVVCALASFGLRCEELVMPKFEFSKDETDYMLLQSDVAKNRGDPKQIHKMLVAGMTSDEFLAIRQFLLDSMKPKHRYII